MNVVSPSITLFLFTLSRKIILLGHVMSLSGIHCAVVAADHFHSSITSDVAVVVVVATTSHCCADCGHFT